MSLSITDYWVYVLTSIVLFFLTNTVFFRWGFSRGRKEVISVFDQILIRMYKLVLSGKNEELHSFLSDVCGKQIDDKLVHNDSGKKGYIQ